MLKIRVVFLEIVNGEAHVHGEEIGQIVVSGDNLAEHFPEVLGHGDLHQPVCGDQQIGRASCRERVSWTV